MAVELAEAYISLIPSAKGIGQKISDELGDTTGVGRDAGDKIGGGLLSTLSGHVGAAAGLIGGVVTVGAVAGIATGLFKVGATFDDAFDKIRTTTGATGAQLESLQENFKTVFANVPGSADDASSAVATLAQKLGLTGEPLTNLSVQLLDLSHITGTDLQANISGVVDVSNSFGIAAADQPAKLDELFRASQATGVGVAELASQMAGAGPNLTQLGLNFEQSAGLLAIFGKAGVDAAAVMPALSKSIVSAAKSGKNAGDVFRETFEAIRNAPDDTTAAGAAIDVFGAKAGPKLAGLIRQGKLGFDELAASIASGGDTIEGATADTADFSEKWGLFKNQILVGLEPLATGVFSAVGNAMAAIGPVVGPVIAEITGGFTAMFAAFKAGDGDVTSSGFPGFMERVANFARAIFDNIKQIDFGAVFAAAGDVVGPVADKLAIIAGLAFDSLKNIDLAAVFKTAGEFLAPLMTSLGTLAGSAADLVIAAFETIKKLFQDNKTEIQFVVDRLGDISNVLRDAIALGISTVSLGMGVLATNMGLVKAVAVPLIAAFVAYHVIVGTISTVQTIAEISTHGLALAQQFLNATMALNPLGLVVAAIAALVVGVIYAYTHFQTFRDIVDGAWQILQSVFHWIVAHWELLLPILTGPFGLAILVVIKNFDKIKAVVTGVVNVIRDHWKLLLAILVAPFALIPVLIVKNFGPIRAFFATIVSAIGTAIGAIVGAFEAVVNAAQAVFTWLTENWSFIFFLLSAPWFLAILAINTAWDTLKAAFTAVVDWIIGGITSIIDGFIALPGAVLGFVLDLFDTIKNGMTTVASWIGDRITDIVGFYIGLPGRVWDAINGLYDLIISGITNAARWVGDRVGDVVGFFTSIPGRIVSSITWIWDTIRNGIDSARDFVWHQIESIVGFFLGMPGRLANAFSGMFDGISAAFKWAVNTVIDGWNSLHFGIPGFNVGPLHFGGFDVGTPHIPRLAAGGTFSAATLAVIGEKSSRSNPEIAAPQSAIRDAVADALRGSRPGIGSLTINPMTMADAHDIAREVTWAQKTAGV